MDTAPCRSLFTGAPVATRRAPSFAGEARFSGFASLLWWSRQDVTSVLDRELTLPAAPAALGDRHPVLVVYGTQRAPALLRGGLSIPLGNAYDELGLFVPCVRHPAAPELVTFVARMYSSYFPAVWEGEHRYFSKALASMGWNGGLFTMSASDGTLLFHAAAEPRGAWTAGAACALPSFTALDDALAAPMVGRRDDGRLAWSAFGWRLREAAVRAVDAVLSFHAALTPGMRPRDDVAAAPATLEVRDVVWRLSWPALRP
jgi:hypothetical protein